MSELLIRTSTVADGNMSYLYGDTKEVLRNRTRFLHRAGADPAGAVAAMLQHRDHVEVVSTVQRGLDFFAEALVTDAKNLFLTLHTADCLPVVLHDPVREVVALAHLGWGPTGLQLLPKVIGVMAKQFKSAPTDIHAYFGPAILKDSYVVDEILQKDDSRWHPFLEDTGDEKIRIGNVGYNKAQLIDAGVLETHIFLEKCVDTYTSPNYFSHRRSVVTGAPEGRFLTVAALATHI